MIFFPFGAMSVVNEGLRLGTAGLISSLNYALAYFIRANDPWTRFS